MVQNSLQKMPLVLTAWQNAVQTKLLRQVNL